MRTFVPNYYPNFSCRAGACRHSCCIGWEIGIDSDTLGYYKTVGGKFGSRLRESIVTEEDTAYFRLTEDERCPFLNAENLCDIFISLGEEHLCQICSDHPRYRNYVAGRCEMGLGLACEAAGELILSQREKVGWICLGEDDEEAETSDWENEIFAKRQAVLDILQNREKSVDERTRELFGDVWFRKTPEEWHAFFLGLERMEDVWEDRLSLLTAENADWRDENSDIRWEQLLVYFVNRHLADACDEWDFDARLGFAVLSYAVIRTMAEGMLRENGRISPEELVELARLYSAEIEYSEDNTAAVIDEVDAAIN